MLLVTEVLTTGISRLFWAQVPGAGSDGLMLDSLWNTAEGSSSDGGACGEVYLRTKIPDRQRK